MIVSRTFSVLAAICLVGAFAIALIVSPTEPLVIWLGEHAHTQLVGVQSWMVVHAEPVFHYVLVPVLERPIWLVPGCLGLVCLGVVLTVGSRKTVAAERRRRS